MCEESIHVKALTCNSGTYSIKHNAHGVTSPLEGSTVSYTGSCRTPGGTRDPARRGRDKATLYTNYVQLYGESEPAIEPEHALVSTLGPN